MKKLKTWQIVLLVIFYPIGILVLIYRTWRKWSLKKEREAAEGSDDVKSLFELNIKIGTVESVFAAWEAWRAAHNICPELLKEGLA